MTVLYALANVGVVLRLSDEVRAAPGVVRPTSAFSPFVALPCPFASPSPPLARRAAGAAWRALHRSCDRHPHRRCPSVLATSEAGAALGGARCDRPLRHPDMLMSSSAVKDVAAVA